MRIVVAHPSPLLRSVLVGAFAEQTDVEEITATGAVEDLDDRCRTSRAHVALASVTFPEGNLLDRLVRILRDGTRVLVLCDEAVTQEVTPLLLAGASGCVLLPDCDMRHLVGATRDVVAGHGVLHPAAAAAVLRHWRENRSADEVPNAEPAPSAAPALTPRESQVLTALGQGWTTKRIGRELSVSPKTIETHIGKLLVKLNARNRAQAISQARRYGFVDPVGENAE